MNYMGKNVLQNNASIMKNIPKQAFSIHLKAYKIL